MNLTDTLSRDKRRKSSGKTGEDIACIFLERKGYRIIERNYRKPWGEIDIIAEKGKTVRFVEVKTVSVNDFSREASYRPEELVDNRKLRKFARTAALYMERTKDKREFQLDVVGILLNRTTRTARCNLIEQALEDNL